MSLRAKGCLTALALVVGAVLALGWWAFDGSTTWPRTYRYRLTLVVSTPEGERSGSSVVEVTVRFPGGLTRAEGYAVLGRVQGEATIVDLGPRGLLFAPLASEEDLSSGGVGQYTVGEIPFPRREFRGKYHNGISSDDEYAAYLDELNRRKPVGDLPFDKLPMLVRFRNLQDPLSIERVDPINLAAAFGAGVKLARATIAITDDPVTAGIQKVLPWLTGGQLGTPLFPLLPRGLRLRDIPPEHLLKDGQFRSDWK